MSIPKIIHQVWLQGRNEVPARFIPLQTSWRANHPDWTHMFWDDDSITELLQSRFPWFMDTYRSYRHLVQRVDAGRYFILYEYGGFSTDIDMKSTRPLDSLLEQHPHAHMIVSRLPFTEKEGRLLKPILGTDVFYTNAVVATSKGYYVWDTLLRSLARTQNRLSFSKLLNVMSSTGPAFFSRSIEGYLATDPKIVALSERYFESGFAFDKQRSFDEDAYAEHYQEASWHTATLKSIFNFYFRVKNLFKR